jgi:hypothetical protein
MLLFIVPVSFVVFRHLIATFPYLSVNEGTCSANVLVPNEGSGHDAYDWISV